MFRDDPYKVIQGFDEVDAALKSIGIAGYSLFLQTRYWGTKFVFSTYPDAWLECYDHNHFMVIDPVVLWSLTNSGTTRWSEIATAQTGPSKHVMTRAKDFGLKFGAVVVTKSRYQKYKNCMISIARNDRDLTDAEIAEVADILDRIVQQHDSRMGLTDLDITTIQSLAAGKSQDEIAYDMGISRETVKKRIERIRKKIGARNATHMVSIDHSNNLIEAVY